MGIDLEIQQYLSFKIKDLTKKEFKKKFMKYLKVFKNILKIITVI